jgi:hypothetical protein
MSPCEAGPGAGVTTIARVGVEPPGQANWRDRLELDIQ